MAETRVLADPRLASSHLHADVDRLQAQAELSWSRESKALVQLGLRDGQSILEIGCGPGFITEALLIEFPHSTITAVDLDPVMCRLTRERLQAQFPDRLQVVETSILFTDLPPDTFDFAVVRYVFQHLSAPELAAQEILRVLKPGGMLAVLDVDDDLGGLVLPRLPAMAAVAAKVNRIQASQAGDRDIGRKLWRILAQSGFVAVDLGAVLVHSDKLGLDAFLPQYHPDRYLPFIQPAGLTVTEWEAYRDAYDQLRVAPEAFILQLILLASGCKPI